MNTWYHVATTWDGSEVKLYVNGVIDATESATAAKAVSNAPLLIGSLVGTDSEHFLGSRILPMTSAPTKSRPGICKMVRRGFERSSRFMLAQNNSGQWYFGSSRRAEEPNDWQH